MKIFARKNFKTFNLVKVSRGSWMLNIGYLKQLSGLQQIAPVFKANAYGHGIETMSEIARDIDLAFIAVDSYKEALQVRKKNNQPILVMGFIHPANFSIIDLSDFSFAVSRIEDIAAIGATQKFARIHIELETGMKRQGVSETHLGELLDAVNEFPNIKIEGIMSHLADADNPDSSDFTDSQTAKFDKLVEQILQRGHTPKWIHIAQSAGLSRAKSKYANVVRPGISSFGINPLDPADSRYKAYEKLQPVMQITSTIVTTQELEAGEAVSYGLTYKAPQAENIAVIPFGYYEGLSRALSDQVTLLSSKTGQLLPVRGRINMNHTMLDVSNANLKVGDEIIVISNNPDDPNSVKSLCQTFNLFNYEFLVNIADITRRVIVD